MVCCHFSGIRCNIQMGSAKSTSQWYQSQYQRDDAGCWRMRCCYVPPSEVHVDVQHVQLQDLSVTVQQAAQAGLGAPLIRVHKLLHVTAAAMEVPSMQVCASKTSQVTGHGALYSGD